MKKFDTEKKKRNFLKQEGNLITFKTPFNWNGEKYSQILITRLERNRKGQAKIIGFCRDTPWFDSMSALMEAINWKWMEQAPF